MKLLFQSLSASALLLLAVSANALSDETTAGIPAAPKFSPRPGFHVVLNGGLTYGGDTIATTNIADIRGGGFVQIGGGVLYQFENQPLALMLSANYHVDDVVGQNGDVTFSRFPIEMLAYYTGKDRFRIGGGLRFVTSPKFNATVNGITDKIDYSNTTGIVCEVGYQVAPQGWLNFRFVSEKYTPASYSLSSAVIPISPSGSHLGVNFTYEFQ